jgi:hypothetical protein
MAFDTQITLSLTAFDKWALGGIVSIVLTGAGTLAKLAWKAFTNCLPHIQQNTERTNELLTEMVGYLKAKVEDRKL